MAKLGLKNLVMWRKNEIKLAKRIAYAERDVR